MGHDLSLPFNMVKRGRRAVYVPEARASEKMVPSLAGEFARKRRMMSHTWPIVLRGGMLSPRGYPPGYALMILSHRLLRYATPAAAPARPGRERRARGARRRERCTSSRSRCSSALLLGAAARRRVPAAPAADRALLRAHHSLARGGAVGLAAPRHRRRLGGGRGHALSWAPDAASERRDPPRHRRRRLRDRARRSARRVLALAAIAIRLERRGPVIYRQRRIGLHGATVRRAEAAHDGRRRRAHRRGPGGQRGRRAHHARGRAPAAHLARRAAEPGERAARRHVADRPAPDAAGAGRAVHRAPARAPGDASRASPAGRRSTAARRCRGRSGSSSTCTTSSTARWRSTLRILWRTLAMVLGGSGLYKGDAGGWEGEL